MRGRPGVIACLLLGALFGKPFALGPIQVAPIRLLCEYSHTIDDQGKSSPAGGEQLVIAQQNENGIATIKKEGFDRDFSGKISEDEIQGQVEYWSLGLLITETISINRYSGRLAATVAISRKIVVTRFGKCRPVSEKLF